MSQGMNAAEGAYDGSSGIRPTKLTGKSSFSAWKIKTLAYLQSMGLKDMVVKPKVDLELLVTGVSLKPAKVKSDKVKVSTIATTADPTPSGGDGTSTASDQKMMNVYGGDPTQLIRRTEKAYAILLNLLDDELIDLVAHVEPGDAHGVWTVLLDTYEAKSTANLCHKLDLLMHIRFSPEKESFDVFRARFTRLVTQVKEMGETLSLAIQRYLLLKGLPKVYDALVQSLKINDSISIDEVCNHIKDYVETERRRRNNNYLIKTPSDPEDLETAFAALETKEIQKKKDSLRAKIQNDKEKRTKECYLCGKQGHMKGECPIGKYVNCSICRSTGHVSHFCPENQTRKTRENASSDS
jgi:hypothetical protein